MSATPEHVPYDVYASVFTRAEAAEARVAQLEAEGVPGRMHDVDRAFYNLTIKQRDRAWRESEGLRTYLADERGRVKQLREALTEAREWVEHDALYTTNGNESELAQGLIVKLDAALAASDSKEATDVPL